MTFRPHPRRYFRPDDDPFRLTPFRAKVRAIAELGVDTLFVWRFDAQMVSVSAEAFVETILHQGVGASHIVVGHDPSGGRMCGVPRLIRDTPLHEVQSWDAGRGFVDADGRRPFAGKSYRMPTLEQLLTEFPDMPLNIDLKQRDETRAECSPPWIAHRTSTH